MERQYEYSVFHVNGNEYTRFSDTSDEGDVMKLVLAEFDESEIDTVTCKIEPKLI